MNLNTTKTINLDFYDKKYITVDAKQLDKSSRYILVTCTNQGTPFLLDDDSHAVFIRYKKSDGYAVFNSCSITEDGKTLVELSEQMLASPGSCCADLIICEIKSPSMADFPKITNDSELQDASGCILSTMKFYVNVIETPYDNCEIESSYEYNALNELLNKSNQLIKEFHNDVNIANTSANTAKEKADEADKSANISKSYAVGGTGKRENENVDNAKHYYEQTKTHAQTAKSYAVGSTNTRNDEDVDNAKYYYEQARSISESFAGALRPMGTVPFANLPALSSVVEGNMYNISNQFTTDENFKEGPGSIIPAGSNVYKTADGKWDVLAGTPVTGVKGSAEKDYQTGNVNLTPASIGLGNVNNTSDANKPVSTAQQTALNTKISKSGDTMTGALRMKGVSVNTIPPDTTGGHAMGNMFLNKDGSTWGGVGALGQAGNWNSVYASAGTNQPWVSDNGLSITKDSIKWKNSNLVTESSGKALSATKADSATTATKATQDGNGNNIASTYLPKSGGTITGNLTLKGSGNYGNKLNFGDGDYVHISEPTDDCLEIKAKKINFALSNTDSDRFTVNGENICKLTIFDGALRIANGYESSHSFSISLNSSSYIGHLDSLQSCDNRYTGYMSLFIIAQEYCPGSGGFHSFAGQVTLMFAYSYDTCSNNFERLSVPYYCPLYSDYNGATEYFKLEAYPTTHDTVYIRVSMTTCNIILKKIQVIPVSL